MLKIGKMADYALVLTHQLVKSVEPLSTTEDLTSASQLPLATVRKLLKNLVDANIVTSYRGINGGYKLSKAPQNITVADVIAAIEGPITLTECTQHQSDCGLASNCDLKENWGYINKIVASLFSHITLADMAKKIPEHVIELNKSKILNATKFPLL